MINSNKSKMFQPDGKINCRMLVVATDEVSVEIVNSLKNFNPSPIEHLVHFGGVDADYKASSLLRMSGSRGSGRSGHLMKNDQFSDSFNAVLQNQNFHQNLHQAIEHLYRKSESFAYNTHKLSDFFDYQHYYHVILDRIGSLLRTEKINFVLFFDVPHLFYDTIIYQVAQSLSIETLILKQTLWCDRFTSTMSIQDFGKLPDFSLLDQGNFESYLLSSETMPELFYMRGIGQEQHSKGRISIRDIVQLVAFLATTSPLRIFNLPYLIRIIRRMHYLSGKFPEWRDPFANFFHTNSLQYFETLIMFEETKIDWSKKFVYFPLQYQPEMTTATLGHQFSDQLLAIERVAALIPENWIIYVKENPKQTGTMRSPMFFHRLRRIKKAQMVSSHANTHELTKHAQFVATITGTVGWEAICTGKKVLVFGHPWYLSLPGVIQFQNRLTMSDINDFKINHPELEKKIGWLLHRMHRGTINRHAARELEKFDLDQNSKQVVDLLIGIITGQVQVTYQNSEPIEQ